MSKLTSWDVKFVKEFYNDNKDVQVISTSENGEIRIIIKNKKT